MEHLGPQEPPATDPHAFEAPSPGTDARSRLETEPDASQARPKAGAFTTDVAAFRDELLAATPNVFVSRVLVGACIAVYVLMVVRGVSPFLPKLEDLWKWGADFGPFIVLDGQTWRLLSNVFVHVGLLHLAMNMWCLTAFGPLVERLYGNVAFAVIYLLAGVGGSIASMGWNPLMTSAGASGAIFGIIGALLAFVLVHRHTIPVAVLAPLRSSATAFVLYNLLFGLMTPGIDNAAHIGGLVTGFAAGLAMQRHWPATRDRWATPRQIAVGAVLAAGLAGLTFGPLEARIRRDPVAGKAIRQEQAARRFNAFIGQMKPYLSEYDALNVAIRQALQRRQQAGQAPDADRQLVATLESLRSRAGANRRAAASVPIADPALQAARDRFVSAQESLAQAVLRLAEAVREDDRMKISGPGGYAALQARSSQEIQAFADRLDSYRLDHGLQAERKSGR